MPTSIQFGTVMIESSGFEHDPSTATPTLMGYTSGSRIWTLTFPRTEMTLAWSVLESFRQLVLQAQEAKSMAGEVSLVLPVLANLEQWFVEYLNHLRATESDYSDQGAVKVLLNEIGVLQQRLQSR